MGQARPMIVRGPRPKDAFTVVSNSIIRNQQLSWKARGILTFLLSQPDDWRTTATNLARQSPDGIYAVRAALKELAEHGYLEHVRTQDSTGHWRTHTVVYDSPLAVQHRANRTAVFRHSVNRDS